MRIVCPSCAAAYDVPEGMLAPGRIARCARCGNEWLPEPHRGPAPPPQEQAAVAPPSPLAPGIADEPAATPAALTAVRRPRPGGVQPEGPLVRIAWAASFLVLVLLIVAGYTWRDEIMQAWPPIQRLYGLLGLA